MSPSLGDPDFLLPERKARIDEVVAHRTRTLTVVMEALCELKPGDDVLLILTREPFPLYRVLERNGYAWKATDFDDGRFEIRIWDKAQPPAGG